MARKPVEYNATITHRWDLDEGLAVFRVRPEAHNFTTFTPGQYVVLGLNNPDPEKGAVIREYSIASPPADLPDFLDFYVRRVAKPTSDNPLTHLLFELRPGDPIHLGKKIVGRFTLKDELGREDDPRLKVLVAAGTGLAPFTSMVFQRHRLGMPLDDLLVLHGASYPRQLGYRIRLEETLNTVPHRARYVPTVSRRTEEPWPGFHGRVETFFEEDKLGDLERHIGVAPGFIRPENAAVFICGLQGTIADTIRNLLHRGFVPGERNLRRAFWIAADQPASLFFEQYDDDPILDLTNEELMVECRDKLERAGVKLSPPEDEPIPIVPST